MLVLACMRWHLMAHIYIRDMPHTSTDTGMLYLLDVCESTRMLMIAAPSTNYDGLTNLHQCHALEGRC